MVQKTQRSHFGGEEENFPVRDSIGYGAWTKAKRGTEGNRGSSRCKKKHIEEDQERELEEFSNSKK